MTGGSDEGFRTWATWRILEQMLRSCCLCAPLLAAACGFQVSSAGNIDASSRDAGIEGGTGDDASDGPLTIDAMIDAAGTTFVPLHVPAGGRAPGSGAVSLGNGVIDTATLSIPGGLPGGVTFDVWPQGGALPDLAVLHVSTFAVSGGATVRVLGSRPLVVVASGVISINGVLDAGARRATPGAGGNDAMTGSGAGGIGKHSGTYFDSGAGGGGFGSVAAAGGGATCNTTCGSTITGGAAGTPNGDLVSALIGGSGGGNPATSASCGATTGGAGGGAVQLSSPTSIAIGSGGGVLAGGGGGDGGVNCNGGTWGAGGGGGSGGGIVLQAPVIMNQGVLAANGGGGGGGAGTNDGNGSGPGIHGQPGSDGGGSTAVAVAGGDVGTWSSSGGNGAALTGAAQVGVTNTDSDGNGGGGGGAVGRILFAVTTVSMGTCSPAPQQVAF